MERGPARLQVEAHVVDHHAPVGLDEAIRYLQGVTGVGFARFSASDVVRHPLVTRIVAAYVAHDLAGKIRRNKRE